MSPTILLWYRRQHRLCYDFALTLSSSLSPSFRFVVGRREKFENYRHKWSNWPMWVHCVWHERIGCVSNQNDMAAHCTITSKFCKIVQMMRCFLQSWMNVGINLIVAIAADATASISRKIKPHVKDQMYWTYKQSAVTKHEHCDRDKELKPRGPKQKPTHSRWKSNK